jgi:hypothetical protein
MLRHGHATELVHIRLTALKNVAVQLRWKYCWWLLIVGVLSGMLTALVHCGGIQPCAITDLMTSV